MTKTLRITYTAIFAAIASVVMFFEFPIPFMPPFLQVDLSGAVILIGAFIFGIRSGIAMILIKDLIHLMKSQTAGSGELADFFMLTTLILVAVSIYKHNRTRLGAIIGCSFGSFAMAIMGIITNKFLIIPFYTTGIGMPLDAILEMCSTVNPFIGSMNTYLMLGVFPFNIIKGVVLTIITLLVYKKLSMLIKSKHFTFKSI